LPEQKIAQAHFSTGTDKEIYVGETRSVQVCGKKCFIDIVNAQSTFLYLTCYTPGSSNNFSVGTIAQC
jgi:hypothetical protein